MPCSYIEKQLRGNILQLQAFISFYCLSRLQRLQPIGDCYRYCLFYLSSNISDNSIGLIDIQLLSIAHQDGRLCFGDHHLRRIEPFHHWKSYDNSCVFPLHVSRGCMMRRVHCEQFILKMLDIEKKNNN